MTIGDFPEWLYAKTYMILSQDLSANFVDYFSCVTLELSGKIAILIIF
ncbi:hypothetical protein [Acinetobacter sp. S40]|nr:hypothetical protein [Acinetobacter sp. S40]